MQTSRVICVCDNIIFVSELGKVIHAGARLAKQQDTEIKLVLALAIEITMVSPNYYFKEAPSSVETLQLYSNFLKTISEAKKKTTTKKHSR